MSDSGFDPGLADPARAGVFFVTEDDLGPLAAVGRDAGLLARRIDLSGCDGKAALLLRIATVVDRLIGQGLPADRIAARFQAGFAPGGGDAEAPVVELKLVCCLR